jgi:putative sigma-54 modulation protein
MEVEFTARQVKISKVLRAQAEEGMERIGRILGKTAHASIIFTAQRHLQMVELNVQVRSHSFAAAGEGNTLDGALKEAIDRALSQAKRYRDRRLESKRLPKAEPVAGLDGVGATGNGKGNGKGRTSIAVHSFPNQATVVEPHIVKSADAISLRPMTIEEAVKDTEFRDRDLLIFRNPAGEMFVLHRRRNGEMELVEIP